MKIYYCGKESCQPEHFWGPAVRNHYLLHFILDGHGVYKTQEEMYQMKAGEAFLIRPGEITYYIADKINPWVYAWIAFDGPDTPGLLKERNFTDNHLVGKIDISKNDRIRQLLMDIVTVFEEPNHDEKELLGYFYLIMSCMEMAERNEDPDFEKEYLDKSLDYIHHNYSYDINITDVARHVGIDRTYLYRIFIKYKLAPPKQYLTSYRLLAAKDMLENTEYNITEIAMSTGFHDQSSFSKTFQREENMTPIQYRRMKKYNGLVI